MQKFWNLMNIILKLSWRSINFIRKFVVSCICMFLIFILINGYFTYTHKNKNNRSYNGALLIDLQGYIIDKALKPHKYNKISQQLLGLKNKNIPLEMSIFEIINSIRTATYDNKITGIVLKLDNLYYVDFPSAEYIGKALTIFKKTGKPIYAIGKHYTQMQYYLASFANKIYISPRGNINIKGFSTGSIYYKQILDKLKIKAHVFRVGKYKTAVEPVTRNNMSLESKESDKAWLSLFWQKYLNQIAKNRKITTNNVFPGNHKFIELLKKFNGNSAKYLIHQKLVDYVISNMETESKLSKIFGLDQQKQSYNKISIYNYINEKPEINDTKKLLITSSTNKSGNIAVIIANGLIGDNFDENTEDVINSTHLAAQIKTARLNPNIKAIILRVNSPGGGLNGSEIIYDELMATRQSKKPIVVSMGGLAASGGYFISAPANYIIAHPTTLTGSIGIFTIIKTYEDLLNKIGIFYDSISTTELSDFSASKKLNKTISDYTELSIKDGYHTFIQYVATNRKKTLKAIDKIAQGRLWSGTDAFKHGLVDKLGDFDDAITKASQLAKINTPVLEWIERDHSLLEDLFFTINFNTQIKISDVLNSIFPTKINNELQKQINFFKNVHDSKNQYVLCLNCSYNS